MVLLFYYIFLFGFIVYVFPLYHILYGLIAVFILKKPKAGLCLILGGAILEALAYFVFYSSNTIPWLKQFLTLPWAIACLLCYIGIYLVDKEKNIYLRYTDNSGKTQRDKLDLSNFVSVVSEKLNTSESKDVMISADKAIDYGFIVEIMSLLKESGASAINIDTAIKSR